jgi:hypothetical protein
MMKLRNRHKKITRPEHEGNGHLEQDRLPIDARTGQPVLPMAQPGYYPGFSTLDQQAFWDEATRKVVLDRIHNVPPIRFFSPEEARLMQAVCDRILPQDDRDEEHKIPLVNYIDERLYNRRIDGYQFEDMPPDHEAHRLGLQAIDRIAQCLYGRPFVEIGPRAQDHVLQTIHDGEPPAAHEIWEKMSVHHFWPLLVQDAIDAYYAHPYAWDEIGFGGPAYPRGYMRLERGQADPWEVNEQRYDWQAPPTTLSDVYTYLEAERKKQPSGQKGTH